MDLDNKMVNMNFRLSQGLRDAMRARADYLGMNMSQFFRNAMEKELNINREALVDSNLKGIAEKDTKPVNFFCPIALADEFTRVCEQQNIPKSVVLRQFMQDYVNHYKDNK